MPDKCFIHCIISPSLPLNFTEPECCTLQQKCGGSSGNEQFQSFRRVREVTFGPAGAEQEANDCVCVRTSSRKQMALPSGGHKLAADLTRSINPSAEGPEIAVSSFWNCLDRCAPEAALTVFLHLSASSKGLISYIFLNSEAPIVCSPSKLIKQEKV